MTQHDRKVLRDIVQHNEQGVLGRDVLLGTQDLVLERLLVWVKVEILRITSAKKLDRCFHEFFAGEFRAGQPLENGFAVFGVQSLALGNSGDVGAFELEPPIWF